MKKNIYKYIQKFYFEKDKIEFKRLCNSFVNLPNKLLNSLDLLSVNSSVYNHLNNPELVILFSTKSYKIDNFKIEYKTTLRISKISQSYHIEHSFELENPDPKRMGTLRGVDELPYNTEQYELEEQIINFFEDMHFQQLNYSDLNEVIPNLEMPESRIFGNQMTVEIALFHDLYGFLDEE